MPFLCSNRQQVDAILSFLLENASPLKVQTKNKLFTKQFGANPVYVSAKFPVC